MLARRIGNVTIKDLFEELMGEDNTKKVLTKIQEEYDKGVTGEELKEFAQQAIDEISELKPESVRLLVAVVAIIVI